MSEREKKRFIMHTRFALLDPQYLESSVRTCIRLVLSNKLNAAFKYIRDK